MAYCDCDEKSIVPFSDCGDCVGLCCRQCHFALMFLLHGHDVCDLFANIARVFKLIRRSFLRVQSKVLLVDVV